jgi:GT2 family glycosyltransferase
VVAAFLELPLELGVRGPVRLVPLTVCFYGAVARLRERLLGFFRRALESARQFAALRQAAPADLRHGIPSFDIPFALLTTVLSGYPGQSFLHLGSHDGHVRSRIDLLAG